MRHQWVLRPDAQPSERPHTEGQLHDVKIADFGLSKAVVASGDGGNRQLSNLPRMLWLWSENHDQLI